MFSSSRLLCGREQLSGSVGCSGLQSVSQSQQQIKYLAIVKGEFMCGRDNKYNRTSFFGGGGSFRRHFTSHPNGLFTFKGCCHFLSEARKEVIAVSCG